MNGKQRMADSMSYTQAVAYMKANEAAIRRLNFHDAPAFCCGAKQSSTGFEHAKDCPFIAAMQTCQRGDVTIEVGTPLHDDDSNTYGTIVDYDMHPQTLAVKYTYRSIDGSVTLQIGENYPGLRDMLERAMRVAKYCPACGKRSAIPNGGAFLEEGEYDEARQRYQNERDVDRYDCGYVHCKEVFYA